MAKVSKATAKKSAAGRSSTAPLNPGHAFLTEAARQVDIIHISLVGMTAIVLTLLVALSLPVFGMAPVEHMSAFIIMVIAALSGIGYLYYVNYRVHRHVSNQSRLTEVLVNSLGQGFLSFDHSGVCGPVYSQASIDLLESIPAGKTVIEVLRIPSEQHGDFKDWMDILFMPHHALGFDDVITFLPQFFPHSQGRRVSLMYRPIRNKDGELVQVVVIATDQTDEFDAQQQLKQQQSFAEMIGRIFKERNQFYATLTHIRQFLDEARANTKRDASSPILRSLHTLKAAVKHFHLDKLGDIIGRMESDLRSDLIQNDEDYRRALGAGVEDVEKELGIVLGQVRDLIGQDYEGRGTMHEVEETVLYDFAREMSGSRADRTLIHSYLSNIVAVPANECLRLFERELRDLAEMIGKQIKPVRFTGTNPRVLRQPIHEFLFSLTHISRNIIDHGIEPSVTRLARGKDPAGQISIHIDTFTDATDKREWLQIIISDDGNGIDPSRIRAKLATTDPHGNWHNDDDVAIIQRIFNWGFSTRESVSELSGRGVGLEVVEREVTLLGGTIRVQSELYRGTKFEIKIPYSLDLNDKKAF